MSANHHLENSGVRFAVLTYAFPHRKSTEGLSWLVAAGLIPHCAVAAPFRVLNLPDTRMRSSIPGLVAPNPVELLRNLDISVLEAAHSAPDTVQFLQNSGADFAVILGSRILKPDVIAALPIGILNLHPGILPSNRGRDTVRHAILRGQRQAVSAHWIDEAIDMGRLLAIREVAVFEGDTVSEIDARVTNAEFPLMVEVIEKIQRSKGGFAGLKTHSTALYNEPLSEDQEKAVEDLLPHYLDEHHGSVLTTKWFES